MPAKTFGDSLSAAYTTATELAFDMLPGRQYRLYCSTDAWFRVVAQGGAVAAASGAGSHPIKAGIAEFVSAHGTAATRVSVVQASAGGVATISEVVDSIQV